jgi:hypothetical protein
MRAQKTASVHNNGVIGVLKLCPSTHPLTAGFYFAAGVPLTICALASKGLATAAILPFKTPEGRN